jgi:hypothetical protein
VTDDSLAASDGVTDPETGGTLLAPSAWNQARARQVKAYLQRKKAGDNPPPLSTESRGIETDTLLLRKTSTGTQIVGYKAGPSASPVAHVDVPRPSEHRGSHAREHSGSRRRGSATSLGGDSGDPPREADLEARPARAASPCSRGHAVKLKLPPLLAIFVEEDGPVVATTFCDTVEDEQRMARHVEARVDVIDEIEVVIRAWLDELREQRGEAA